MAIEHIKALIEEKRYLDVVTALNNSFPNGEHELTDDVKILLNSCEEVEFMHYPDYLWCFGERSFLMIND